MQLIVVLKFLLWWNVYYILEEAREELLDGRDSQNLSEHSDVSRLDKCASNDLSITRSSDTSDTGCTGILVKETTKEESLEDVTQQVINYLHVYACVHVHK